jgi:Putative transposase
MRRRWTDSRHNNRSGVMTLHAVEFIRRFLLHVLPAGFVKIRHFGLLANRNRRQALALCRIHLHAPPDISALLTEPQKSALNRSCAQCKRGTLHVVTRQLSASYLPMPRIGSA